jgi:hypothetical protein
MASLGIFGIAIRALQIAAGEANENGFTSRKGAFALDREEHGMEVKDVFFKDPFFGLLLVQLHVCKPLLVRIYYNHLRRLVK